MESHPNYSNIVYTFVRKIIRGRIKIFTVPKAKSMLKNINHRMLFVILLCFICYLGNSHSDFGYFESIILIIIFNNIVDS